MRKNMDGTSSHRQTSCLKAGRAQSWARSPLALFLTLLLAVAWPRLALLGYYPAMDEGSYAFIAALCRQNLLTGEPLPSLYGIPLYPLLTAWVYDLPGMPMIWFRLCDLGGALACGWLLCRILQDESENSLVGLFLGFIFLACLNFQPVIDAGYKNSIPIALFFLLAAFRVAKRPASRAWLAAGALTACAVLLREPLAPFAFLGFFGLCKAAGWRAAWRYASGGLIIAILALIMLHLSQPQGLIAYLDGYRGRSAIYSGESARVWANFGKYALESLTLFAAPLILACAAAFVFYRGRAHPPRLRGRMLFWLCAAALPLIEPLTKIGFVYHFSVCLPGLAGFCALAWRKFAALPADLVPHLSRGAGAVIAAALICLCLPHFPGPEKMLVSWQSLKNFPTRNWPESMAAKSVPIATARAIMADKPKTLATSGFSFFLYYITGLMPPASGAFDPRDQYHLADLSRTFALLGHDGGALARAIAQNPPEAIAVGIPFSTHESDYHAEILNAIHKTGLYRETARIKNRGANYGWIGYAVFQAIKDAAPPDARRNREDS